MSNSSFGYIPLHLSWLERLTQLQFYGTPVAPRDQPTLEFLNQRIVLDSRANLLDVPARGLNYRFAVAEWLWMAFGRNDLATLTRYNSVMRRFSDDGLTLTGAYGPHIARQRHKAASLLRSDPTTRQAVIEISRPRVTTKDEPCTLSLQYLQRNRALHCIATMRSSDVWLGVPYDVFSFTQLQNCLAGELGLERGWLALNTGSSHLYEHDLPGVVTVQEHANEANTIVSPALPGWPPAWLEDVLIGSKWSLPHRPDEEPWWSYARCLQAKTSQEAHAILKGLA